LEKRLDGTLPVDAMINEHCARK